MGEIDVANAAGKTQCSSAALPRDEENYSLLPLSRGSESPAAQGTGGSRSTRLQQPYVVASDRSIFDRGRLNTKFTLGGLAIDTNQPLQITD